MAYFLIASVFAILRFTNSTFFKHFVLAYYQKSFFEVLLIVILLICWSSANNVADDHMTLSINKYHYGGCWFPSICDICLLISHRKCNIRAIGLAPIGTMSGFVLQSRYHYGFLAINRPSTVFPLKSLFFLTQYF